MLQRVVKKKKSGRRVVATSYMTHRNVFSHNPSPQGSLRSQNNSNEESSGDRKSSRHVEIKSFLSSLGSKKVSPDRNVSFDPREHLKKAIGQKFGISYEEKETVQN